MVYRLFVLIWFMLFASLIHANEPVVRIGIFYDEPVSSVVVSFPDGGYLLFGDRVDHMHVGVAGNIYITLVDSEIWVRTRSGHLGIFRKISLISQNDTAYLKIRTTDPLGKYGEFQGDFHIDPWNGFLRIVNELEENRYIASVVEAEAGPGAPLEFLKTQCIVSRTYYYFHRDRHVAEGFYVCDDTHCQVYKGRNDNERILSEASIETRGMVIFDQDGLLIEAAYHSNSGGEVLGAESLWLTQKPYLKSIPDRWSESGSSYRWERRIPFPEWNQYLERCGIDTDHLDRDDMKFSQSRRHVYYVTGNDSILFRQIREDLGLRSSYFNINFEGDMVVLNGRGYGHGIGLSQEGGIEMARHGYWFPDIIRYYYPGVTIKRFSSR